jgi:pimeloyl-ACP methyl ester carboxylesterase
MSHLLESVTHRRSSLPRPAEMLRWLRDHLRERIVFHSLLGAGIVVWVVAGWPLVKAHLQAIAILQQISGKPVPAIVGDFVAQPIRTEDVTLHVQSGNVRARLYVPVKKSNAPAMIVLHGVHHLGIDEPRLIAFASAMANCGIQVLTPELPDIMDYHVDAASIITIGQSTQWFAKRTGAPVGVMGLSFSGGLALIAAGDPLYHPNFKFVFAVGSQDSMARVVQYYRTGADVRPNGTDELLPAHEYGPLVIEYEYVQDFVPPQDVAAIRPVLRAHLYEDKGAEQLAEARLNDAQKEEAADLMDANSAQTQAMIANVSVKHTFELEELSPEKRLRTMTTPVYLLHGEADNIIPSAETLWMAQQLPQETLQAVLVSRVISHIDMDHGDPGLLEQWRLVHFFALVMHAVNTPGGRKPWL